MLKSMTGFGRFEAVDGERKITVEMKSVNHRYLDTNIKLPKKFNYFESAIRVILKEYAERGKIDVYVTYEDLTESNICIKYNSEIAKQYVTIFDKISKDFGVDNDIRTSIIARLPEVIVMEEQAEDEEELWNLLEKAVRSACEGFVETRAAEGERIKKDLLEKLDGMLTNVAFIEERSPQIITEYKDKITTKIAELLGDANVDESRIVTEVTIFADKVCVDEELVRLRSHIEAMKNDLLKGGPIGRKLDFIAQEMNREANTTLSKSTDLSIADKAIELKTDIEKVREQIQNIE
ncbi:MAG: YicC/YloC family endoribonuclease [Eubacterium sp.]